MIIFLCKFAGVITAILLLSGCRAAETSPLGNGPLAELIRTNISAADLSSKLGEYISKEKLSDARIRYEFQEAGMVVINRTQHCETWGIQVPNNSVVKAGSTEVSTELCDTANQIEFRVTKFGAIEE